MSKLLTVLLILPSGAELSSIDGDFVLDQDFHDALESVRHGGVIFIVGLPFRESSVRSLSSKLWRLWRLRHFTGALYTFVTSVKVKKEIK